MNRIILGLVAVVALCSTATASAASSQTLRLIEKQTFEHNVDRGAKGESSGDIRDFGGILYQGDRRVGRDRIHCVVDAGCTAVMWLRAGTLHSRTFRPAAASHFSVGIRSGTGAYRGVKGHVEVITGGPSLRYIVHLDL